jgi:hypothetical protein
MEKIFDEIAAFCKRNTQGDVLRSLVCGLYWFDDGHLAVNTLHLRILLGKSKSSINGALVMMNYLRTANRDQETEKLLSIFPQLKTQWSNIRQWTIRDQIKPEERDDEIEESPPLPPPPLARPSPVQTWLPFDSPQLEMEIENLYQPDDAMLEFLSFNQQIQKPRNPHGFSPADASFR